MASLFTLGSSDQYKTDSASAVTTRSSLVAYLSNLSSSNAKNIISAVDKVLPIIDARMDAITQELKSTGKILSDTMQHASGFKQELDSLSFVNINNLLTNSNTDPNASAVSPGQQVFLDDNFELMKQYRFKLSLSQFYSKYSAHLQDRRERLSESLKTLRDVHDNLTMIREAAVSKS